MAEYIGRARTYAQLKAMSKEDLIAVHDALTPRVSGGVDYFRREIAYREQEEQTREMLRLTRQVTRLTWFIAALTLINVAVFVASLF
jgi:hypothetical protein